MKKIQTLVSTILCLTLGITTIFSNGKIVKADEDIVKELKKEVITLKTVEPADKNLKDLMPLKEILNDKEIVGMGEATHGTSEFFKMKHRVFKFLVEEMGFRAFAMECNFGDGQIINDYILNGVGDELDVINTLSFLIWKKDEVKNMINWMKEYNLKVKDKDKIRFYSFDMQSDKHEYRFLSNYLKKVKPELEKELLGEIPSNLNLIGSNCKEVNNDATDKIRENFVMYKEEMIKKSSKEEYDLILKDLDIIKQSIELINQNKVDSSKVYQLRDKNMAGNIKWIYDREKELGNGKIMLWAHNGHIRKDEFSDLYRPMGSNLDEIFGEKYYALGLEFFKGKFNAGNIYELKESNPKTLGYIFNKLGNPILYFDIKKALNNNKIRTWAANNEVYINDIGASRYDEHRKDEYITKLDVNKAFDGLIFVNETTESKDPIYNFKKNKEDKNIKKCDEGRDTTKLAVIVSLSLIGIAIIGAIVSKNKKRNISK